MRQLFSADDHVVENPRVWVDRVPRNYRDAAPHIVAEAEGDVWYYEDCRQPTIALGAVAGLPDDQWNMEPIRFSEMHDGYLDPAARARDLMSNGVCSSVCFPSFPRFGGTLFNTFRDKDLADVCVRAYNDFMLDEWCGDAPSGFHVPVIIGQLWDPVRFAAEIRRCATRGARALTFPENPVPLGLPSVYTDYWDPVWQACQDTQTVVCMHIGSSSQTYQPSPDAPPLLGWSLLTVGTWLAMVNILMSPVCRRFPDSQIVLAEGGIGWIPAALERADRFWSRHRRWMELDDTLPSEIFSRNISSCVIEEPIGIGFREFVGVDRILWECDYPHSDSTWPHSQESADTIMETFTDDEVAQVSHGNAERLFRWTMATLEPAPTA